MKSTAHPKALDGWARTSQFMKDLQAEIERCDRELERIWNSVAERSDELILMGLADWSCEKEMLKEMLKETALHKALE